MTLDSKTSNFHGCIRVGRDSMLRISSLELMEPGGPSVFHREDYTYNDASMRTRIEYSAEQAGVLFPTHNRVIQYDNLFRLTEDHKLVAGTNATAWRYAYTYDAAGNRTGRSAYIAPDTTVTETLQYNSFNQMTTFTVGGRGGWTQAFTYDQNGNRITKTGSTSQYYQHDRWDRLEYVLNAMYFSKMYTYDPAGRRILETDSADNKTKYYFDGLTPVLVKEKPSGSTVWRTKFVNATAPAAIGQILAQRQNTAWTAQGTPTAWSTRGFQYDLTGSVLAVIDYAIQQVTKVEMEPFGNVVSGGNSPGPRLTTKDYDPTAGMYWFGARWYDPQVGQWGGTEPLGIGMNLYGFVDSDPLGFVDPDGYLKELVVFDPIVTFFQVTLTDPYEQVTCFYRDTRNAVNAPTCSLTPTATRSQVQAYGQTVIDNGINLAAVTWLPATEALDKLFGSSGPLRGSARQAFHNVKPMGMADEFFEIDMQTLEVRHKATGQLFGPLDNIKPPRRGGSCR